jgi:hypothetical protein
MVWDLLRPLVLIAGKARITESLMTRHMIAVSLILLVACGGSRDQVGTQTAPQTQTPAQAPLPTGTLDQLLAPVALYPDSLLAQMLMSATDPPKIAELDKWLKANQTLKGTQLQDAAVKAGFEASFVALVLFPQVVEKMAVQSAWTTILGQAFTADRNAVFASIQKLRLQAKNVGTLKSNAQQDVEVKKTSAGQDVIVIEPANPQIVYVPVYNTEVVYTQPPATTTTVIVEQDNSADVAVAAGLIGFTAGIAIGAAMDNNYYYGPYGWHGGGYMYNDAWDDYYDHREDAREDWMDHREDLVEERSDRLEDRSEQRTDRLDSTQEQRTDRQENRQENRPEGQAQRQENRPEAQAQRQEARPQAQAQRTERTTQAAGATAPTQRANRTGSTEARGYGSATSTPAATQRSSPDAFSGYSSGQSQRASSARGQQSRGSSRSRGGGGRRR